jgi:hypothetical protein
MIGKQMRQYKGIDINPNNGPDNYLRWWVNIGTTKQNKFRTLKECRDFITSTIRIGKWMKKNQRMLKDGTLSKYRIDKLDSVDPTWRTTNYTIRGEL